MKKLISTFAISIIALGSYAQESALPFSYASDEIVSYGFGSAQRYDVAMLIDNPELTGKKIKTINAYVTSSEGLEDGSVWLASELVLDGKNIKPDIDQQEAEITSAQYAGYNVGLISYTFDNPYVYDGNNLYVGYSVYAPSTSTDAQRNPVLIARGDNSNGLFLHGSSFPLIWRNYYETTQGGVAVIVVELEGDYADDCMSVSSIDYTLTSLGNDFSVKAFVSNTGLNPVSSISYEYEVLGQTFNKEMTFESPIQANLAQSYPINIEVDALNEIGLHPFTLSIKEVNGKPNESEYDSAEGNVGVLEAPIVHRPVVEEFTGLGCGWCPRGFTGMEAVSEEFGNDAIVMCYHYPDYGADPMQVTNVTPVNYSTVGMPSACINRSGIIIDPYYGSSYNVNFGILDNVQEAIDSPTYCNINITDVNIDGDNMTFTTETVFGQVIENAKYKIGYVLTGNGLTNENWGQNNYFALPTYIKDYRDTPLGEWCTLGTVVYGLVFNDVVINATGMAGIANSLPSSINFNEVYTNNFEMKVGNLTNISGTPLPYKVSQAVLNVFVIDGSTGAIINANKFLLGNSAAVESVNTDTEVVSSTYYDLTGRKLSNPVNGIFIKVDKLSDGTTRSSKIAVK